MRSVASRSRSGAGSACGQIALLLPTLQRAMLPPAARRHGLRPLARRAMRAVARAAESRRRLRLSFARTHFRLDWLQHAIERL